MRMFIVACLVCIYVIALVGFSGTLGTDLHVKDDEESLIREKVIANGREAVGSILKDAIPTQASKRLQPTYRKTGGLQKLFEDFNKFRPQRLQNPDLLANEAEARAGVVADRILVARTKGKAGRPTLTIFKAKDVRQLEIERKLSLTTETIDDIPHVEITYININL